MPSCSVLYSVHPSVECTRTPISKIKVLFVVVAVVEIIPRSSHSPVVVDPTLKWGRARGSYSSSSIGAGRRGEGRRRYIYWLTWLTMGFNLGGCGVCIFVEPRSLLPSSSLSSSRVSASLFAKQPQTSIQDGFPFYWFSQYWAGEFRLVWKWYENVVMRESIAILAIKLGSDE